jgi:hypothetical protein
MQLGKILGDNAAVTAMLDRLLHHAHVIKTGPRSWRTREKTGLRSKDTERYSSPRLGRLRMGAFETITYGRF